MPLWWLGSSFCTYNLVLKDTVTKDNDFRLHWTYFCGDEWTFACEGLNGAEIVLLSRIVEELWAAPIMTVSREDLMVRHNITAGSKRETMFNCVFQSLEDRLFISTKLDREY